MPDTNTLKFVIDKTTAVEGDPLKLTLSGQLIRESTETVDPPLTTTQLGGGDTKTADVPPHAVTTADNENVILQQPKFLDQNGTEWTSTSTTTATAFAQRGKTAGVAIPLRTEDGATISITGPSVTVTAKPPTTTGPKFPGDPKPGFVRWGAAIDGNADPAYHESPAGHIMGLRRTFWGGSSSHTGASGSLVNTARGDLAKGRLPWVSFKPFTGSNWDTIGKGQYDSQIDTLLRALGGLTGPVWLTFNHEPENDNFASGSPSYGGAPTWRAAQSRIISRLRSLQSQGVARNVAFSTILMAWTFDSRSGRNPADWWVPGADFYGVDHYIESTSATMLDTRMWQPTRNFYLAKGVPMAVGEWGNRGTDAGAAADMQQFYDHAIQSGGTPSRIVGLSYFDSGLNSATGSWELQGEPLTKFRALFKDPRSLLANESGT